MVPPLSPAAWQVIHASRSHWVVIAAVGVTAVQNGTLLIGVPAVVLKPRDGMNVAADVVAIDPSAFR